ncbi:hypothetical protein [Microvirga calopogonii]|uniref:hypothetical protein n=1 Tax=Microvirga calopogonii TaxID=2078013 RepID=UPI0013B43040|nr:hypothetical protein [Microvirga calopogonii]
MLLETALASAHKKALWDQFCEAHSIATRSVPLFAADSMGRVEVVRLGEKQAPFLRRSPAMEDMIGMAVEQVLAAPPDDAEGLLYMMLRLDEQGGVIPLYVGRAGRHGKNGSPLSANLKGIQRTRHGGWGNGRKFARWGYGFAYHIGDLSCAALHGHEPRQPAPKYLRWARHLFSEVPSTSPKMRFETRFWCTTWRPTSPSIWREFGACPLAFIEYLLIGVASLLFPTDLLNEEGVNRRVTQDQ